MTAPSGNQLLAGILVVVVVTVVGAGVAMLGPPSEERARRLDDRRVSDLRRIALAVHLFNMRHQRLPVSVEELSGEPGVSLDAGDPATKERYPYRVIDFRSYEVCASFDHGSGEARAAGFWSHGSGRQCFTLNAEATVE